MNPDEDLVPAVFGDSDELSVGDWVLAIGNPGGIEFSSSPDAWNCLGGKPPGGLQQR